jgi:hypothetical protein
MVITIKEANEMSNRNKVLLLCYFSALFLIIILFLPVSGWGFYYSQVTSNIYAEDFNLDTNVGLPGKGLFFYLTLMRSLSVICDCEPMALAQIAGAASIVIVTLVYVYFLSKVPGNRTVKLAVGLLYPIVLVIPSLSYRFGYVSPYSTILMLLILSILFYNIKHCKRFENVILLVVLWVALGLYWHTLQVLTLGILCAFFATSLLSKQNRNGVKPDYTLFLLLSAIFIIMWIYVRDQTLYNLLSEVDINFDISSIFNRGSFTEGYSYQSHISPAWGFDPLRYVSYIISLGVMGAVTVKYIFCILKGRDAQNYLRIFSILFISEIIFMGLYFFATGITAPRILLTVSLPILLIILNSDIKFELNLLDTSALRKAITIILVLATCSAIPYSAYTYFEETAEKNIAIEDFEGSLNWILEYIPRNTIISNSHTCGNYMLLYGHSRHWADTQRLSFGDMTYNVYDELVTMEYDNSGDEILVINDAMYIKHLKQESIQYWNVYNPISPEYVSANKNLAKLYTDGTVFMYA